MWKVSWEAEPPKLPVDRAYPVLPTPKRGCAPILQVCSLSQRCRVYVWVPHLGSFHSTALLLEGLGVGCWPWGWCTWPRSLSRAPAFQRTLLHLTQRPQGQGVQYRVPSPGGEWLLPTDRQVNVVPDGHSSPRPLLSLSPPLRAALGAMGLDRAPKLSAGSLRAASGCVCPPLRPCPQGSHGMHCGGGRGRHREPSRGHAGAEGPAMSRTLSHRRLSQALPG